MLMPAYHALLFDLDGTLVDSLEDLTAAANALLDVHRRPHLTQAEMRTMVGKGARNLVRRILATDSTEQIETGLRLFLEYNTAHIAEQSTLYPHVRTTLERFHGQGIPLAIISNKHTALCRQITQALHIDHLFSLIHGGDSFSEMKPSPLPLLETIRMMGVTPSETLMIGDSINDIEAAKHAGITAVACTWGYGDQSELEGANFSIDSFSHLESLVPCPKQFPPGVGCP